MTTYAETQVTHANDGFNGWATPAVPMEYDLYLACPPNGGMVFIEVEPDSANPTKFVVSRIPASVTPLQVAKKMSRVAFFPAPEQVFWSFVAEQPDGDFIRPTITHCSERDFYEVSDANEPWTGMRTIGFTPAKF